MCCHYWMCLAGTTGLFHWKEKEAARSQRQCLQFTKSMVLPVSFNMIRDGNSTVLLKSCETEGFQIEDDWIKDSGSSLDYVLTNFYN